MITAKELEFPVLQWGKDWIFKADTYKHFVQVDRSWMPTLRAAARAGEVHLLDSAGRLFAVVDAEPLSAGNLLARIFGPPLVAKMLGDERQLDLEEFKKYVRKAVNARQQFDRGSYILEDTMKNLPHAQTYREAIESLPKIY